MINTKAQRIAIVDDDTPFRVALGRVLRASGLDVETYEFGLESLNSLETRGFDCLLLDLQMPGASGMDVLRYLAGLGMTVPIIVITARDASEARAECLASGVSAFFSKPVERSELLQAIANVAGDNSNLTRLVSAQPKG